MSKFAVIIIRFKEGQEKRWSMRWRGHCAEDTRSDERHVEAGSGSMDKAGSRSFFETQNIPTGRQDQNPKIDQFDIRYDDRQRAWKDEMR